MSHPTDSAEAIARIVSWYAPALGLADWEIECRWNEPMVNDSQAEVQRDPCHRGAIVIVSDSVKHRDQRLWSAFHDPENSTVHELIHIAMVDCELAVERAVAMIPDGEAKSAIAKDIDRYQERFICRMAAALKATAYADRSGSPPTIGSVFVGPMKA